MNYEYIRQKVKSNISNKRFKHSLGVVEYAIYLAEKYNCDKEKAKIAAISHDCAKEMDIDTLVKIAKLHELKLDEVTLSEPHLLHGPVGSVIAQEELGIEDEEILNAIKYHTTGRTNMTKLEKIIYLSDVVELNRNYDGIEEVRRLSETDLDGAILLSIDKIIKYVISINSLLHPRTIEARNFIMLEKKRRS
ncbi:MAG: bis(5'-nucleosyl)-tetraphosphatase (symmetrical) YqeK [Eubacteriaceae bacterium]